MNNPWELLQSTAVEALDPIWNEFAKDGKESAVFAPLAKHPNAAAWLAESMGLSDDYITRKLGAMLAGWIGDPRHAGLLSGMLDHERQVFREDPLIANSVGEDIMFAATRWTESRNAQISSAGLDVLAGMIGDALEGRPWNTVHWAAANLHHATEGKHEIFQRLASATEAQLAGQQFLNNAVQALRQNDKQTLGRLVTAPSELCSLPSDDPHYAMAKALWDAAAAAEATLR